MLNDGNAAGVEACVDGPKRNVGKEGILDGLEEGVTGWGAAGGFAKNAEEDAMGATWLPLPLRGVRAPLEEKALERGLDGRPLAASDVMVDALMLRGTKPSIKSLSE